MNYFDIMSHYLDTLHYLSYSAEVIQLIIKGLGGLCWSGRWRTIERLRSLVFYWCYSIVVQAFNVTMANVRQESPILPANHDSSGLFFNDSSINTSVFHDQEQQQQQQHQCNRSRADVKDRTVSGFARRERKKGQMSNHLLTKFIHIIWIMI